MLIKFISKCRVCIKKKVSSHGTAKLRNMCNECFKKNPYAKTQIEYKGKKRSLWDKRKQRIGYCRKILFSLFGSVCMKCNSKYGSEIDHIKPKSIYPELYDKLDNLQILCRGCNKRKGLVSGLDYRTDKQKRIIRQYVEHNNMLGYLKDKDFGKNDSNN